MFRSLRSRLLALLTGIVVLSVGMIGLAAGELVRQSSTGAVDTELRTEARALSRASSVADLSTAIDQLEGLTRTRVFFVRTGGTDPVPGADELRPTSGKATSLLAGRTGGKVTWTQRGKHGIDYVGDAARIDVRRSDDNVAGFVVPARRASDVGSLWRPLALQVGAILLGALVIAWIVALAMSWRLTRPLNFLVAATNDIARGRSPNVALDAIPPGGEIGQLAGSVRDMALQLREVDSRDRRFLMSISHELRTPLTAIAGHAQALQDGLAEEAEARDRSLAVIQREAGRLDRLVEDIIDLARLRSNRFNTVSENVRLDELGEHLMAIFQDQTAQPHVTVRGDFETVDFHSDGQRILQIVRNLINNALRYATTEVSVTGERVRGRIRITVANDGDPVPADMQERIFEPFVGAKREGGMGLGLAIGRELAWALGGNLRIVPSEAGAVFELTLPLEPPGSGR